MVDFVDAVAGDAQDTWERLLGNRYQRTQVVLFRDAIKSACGFAQAATGPFYCPERSARSIWISDSSASSRERFGAPGDFAQAYVIAHEFGHHVQNLLGLTARVQQDPRPGARQRFCRPRTAGGLFRWRLGPRGVAAGPLPGGQGRARAWRRRRGVARGRVDRRRPPAEDVHRPRRARTIHARQFGAARRVVPAGTRVGGSAAVRHVCAGHTVVGPPFVVRGSTFVGRLRSLGGANDARRR